MEKEPRLSLSPILSSYSSDNLTEIAARVVQELTAESEHSDLNDGGGCADFEFTYEGESNYPRIELENHADELNRNDGDDEEEDDDFEFVVAGQDAVSSPISADEIFYNGQIRPIYPVFNRNLYFDGFGFVSVGSNCEKPPPIPPPPIHHPPPPRVRIPLGKLMREDRDPPSCSSSEADELDGIPAEIYCIWKPKAGGEEEVSPEKCKKSNSLGSSSKRWKFRNLLHRSSSEGKDMLVLIPPMDNRGKRKVDKAEEKESEDEAVEAEGSDGGGESAAAEAAATGLRRKPTRVGERKASYRPYRKDLIGLFSNLHPF